MKNIVIATLDVTIMGGVEKSNSNLAKLFKSHGHHVTLISFFKSSESTHFNFDGVEVIYLFNKVIRHGVFTKYFTFILLFKLLIILKKIHSEYLVLSCFPRISLLLSFFATEPKKIIACEHSSFEAHSILIRYLRLFFYKRLRCVVTLTEYDKKIFSNSGINTYKIPNFTDFNKDFIPRDNDYSKQLVCLAVGRLHPHKGFNRLLEIANELKNENIKFIIVGSGSEEKKIIDLIDYFNLHFSVTLFPASTSIDAFMVNADVLLMTSLTEAAPLVILEAFSFSKPVIAYDCPVGPREIITDNVNGFLVNDGDKLQFVNKLKELLRSHILYNDLAEKAGVYAKHNSSENNYKLWLRLFY